MEFLNAKYCLKDRLKCCHSFVCKNYVHCVPIGSSTSPGYALFQLEKRPKITRKNPGSTPQRIGQLVGKAWRQLGVQKRYEYGRRARENETAKRMGERCPGKLNFKRVDGQVLIREDRLVNYVPHSTELSAVLDEPIGLNRRNWLTNKFFYSFGRCEFNSSNVRLGQIVRANDKRPSDESREVANNESTDVLDSNSESDESNEPGNRKLFISLLLHFKMFNRFTSTN